MNRRSVALGPFQKRSLYGVTALLWISGALWLYNAQTWSLKLHGAAAMAFLMVLGALLPVHVRLAWQQKRNRVAGVCLLGLNAFLTLTGWMLYYVGTEQWRPWISRFHWILGLGLPLFIYMHIRFARKYP